MKTKTSFIKAKDIKRQWYLIDAQGKNLGRLCTKIAVLLMGKQKVSYVPFLDCGDQVIVINAKDIQVAPEKHTSKKYQWHSGYPGGYKEKTLRDMLQTKPERVIELAVKRMLPQNRLGRQLIKKLKVYAGPEHGQQAQQPVPYSV